MSNDLDQRAGPGTDLAREVAHLRELIRLLEERVLALEMDGS